MSEQQVPNDDPLDKLIQSWGMHSPDQVSGDLKRRVLQRMTARPAARYRATLALAAAFLVYFCLSAWWWGRGNAPDQLAADPLSLPASPVSQAAVQEQIASLGAELRRTELAARIAKQETELYELQQLLIQQRLELERATVRRQVYSDWLANHQTP